MTFTMPTPERLSNPAWPPFRCLTGPASTVQASRYGILRVVYDRLYVTHECWTIPDRTRLGGGMKPTLCSQTVLSTVRSSAVSSVSDRVSRLAPHRICGPGVFVCVCVHARAHACVTVHQAADPKVYFDSRLGEHGAWIMIYFGTCPLWRGASINIAFSLDLLTWHKASEPLYKAGGHPAGLDKCEAHKVGLSVCLCLFFCFCLCLRLCCISDTDL